MARDDGPDPRNPFAGLEKVRNIEADRRLVRRALSATEFDALITTTERSLRRFCKLSGKRRAMSVPVDRGDLT